MFREMRRFKQQLEKAECLEILKKEVRGVLSVLGDDDYPYGIILDHWYNEKDGKLYFHGAPVGHKIDSIKKHDKVSYVVHDQGYRKEGDWALNIKSVVVFGRAKIVEDKEKQKEICTELCKKFTDDEEYIKKELANALARVCCIELTPEHITGKLVNES
ncbi:MAG: pyridoxamine 5'-phosphate oxidase family protein [Treponema sp.]|nr:pyridoxamine 5'-phosphate oxidase family protein [Treponema sp.]